MVFIDFADVGFLKIEFHLGIIFCNDTFMMKDFNYW